VAQFSASGSQSQQNSSVPPGVAQNREERLNSAPGEASAVKPGAWLVFYARLAPYKHTV